MHSRSVMHSRAEVTCGVCMATRGADMAVSSISRSRMTNIAHIWTSVAALSKTMASKVATLTVIATTHAYRASMTIGGVSSSGSRATPLVSVSTKASRAAITCRTTIASAEAAMTTMLDMVLTAMIVMNNGGLVASMTITWTLERHGLTDCADHSQYV